jgi:hypothetical protein
MADLLLVDKNTPSEINRALINIKKMLDAITSASANTFPVGFPCSPWFSATAPTGWVIATAGYTIGRNSGTYSGSDYYNIFAFLYETAATSATVFKISSAKGANANADWLLGKTIQMDVRGLHARYTGTSSLFKMADGATYFAGAALATEQNDEMQGHLHIIKRLRSNSVPGAGIYPDSMLDGTTDENIGSETSDGTHGTPRTGYETRGANFGAHLLLHI